MLKCPPSRLFIPVVLPNDLPLYSLPGLCALYMYSHKRLIVELIASFSVRNIELFKKLWLFSGYRLLCNENWPKALIYNAFRKLLAKYCQALPQEDSSLIYEISSLQYEKSQNYKGGFAMSSVELGVLDAMSYCWNKHEDSFILARSVRAIAGAVKATFTTYTVSLSDAVAVLRLNPEARFAEPVRRALAAYRVSHAADTSSQLRSPLIAQPARVPVNSPFSFSLAATDTTRVQLISGNLTLSAVNDAYKKMRSAAGEVWIANAGVKSRAVAVDAVDSMVFGNKNHDVLSKYLLTITHPTHGGCSIEEMLQVRDRVTGQLKLVRIGSFSEAVDGSTTGGGGFPGYSAVSATKAGYYLKNLVVKDKYGNDYQPYRQTRFGLGHHDRNNVGTMWSCGFDVLRLELFHATGYKFSFQVLVAFLEEMISASEYADDLRRSMARDHYPMTRTVMKLFLSNIGASPEYPDLLVEEGAVDERRVSAEDRNGDGRVRVCKRREILDSTNWDYSSTAMLCQPAHAFGLCRNKKTDGTYEYMVYDPHNFSRSPDFYASPNGMGRKIFTSAEQAIHYVTTEKGGHNGKLDGFYRLPDAALCFLRDKMMKTKGRLEAEGIGF
ncbi:hypothetical protein [Endozoicomonas sp. SCSIO W0465]|uniref:hypothetical protein n=1 Tax=Endozoicomonas sp. SCSIO W0465 TaxID=2918516 RepID=UPI0020760232|nr:hypothetical protein [Endozoicomonas sp. SCSIO W0465]USE36055.1 hypothetical protein MJO57_29075 [Endozoicomonas sp. SCSIO W0465]